MFYTFSDAIRNMLQAIMSYIKSIWNGHNVHSINAWHKGTTVEEMGRHDPRGLEVPRSKQVTLEVKLTTFYGCDLFKPEGESSSSWYNSCSFKQSYSSFT